jgi:hypothetical protein
MNDPPVAVTDTSWLRNDVASAADSVRSDFAHLVALFEQQLEAIRAGDSAMVAVISEAKEAAERGLRLSCALLNAVVPSIDQDSSAGK